MPPTQLRHACVLPFGDHDPMRIPSILFALSSCAAAAALVVPSLSDLILITGPAWLASLWILLRAGQSSQTAPVPAPTPVIIIDGSNVMHWEGNQPRLYPVREVVQHLQRSVYAPGVVFDANAGYLLDGRYRHDDVFARQLGLPKDGVMVVDKGTPADTVILEAATDLGARVITNDRFREWAKRFPDIRRPGFLIRGGYREGRLWLDLDPELTKSVASLPQVTRPRPAAAGERRRM